MIPSTSTSANFSSAIFCPVTPVIFLKDGAILVVNFDEESSW